MAEPRRAGARIDAAIRKAIRESPDSLRVLARRYGIDPKTVAKWKKRESPEDLRAGPKPGGRRKLSPEDEEIIVTFRERTQLPLDDCLYALQARIPQLTRSTLHRCLMRHGISRQTGGGDPVEAPTDAAVGCLYVDRSEIRSTDGTHHLFSAVDEASKFAFLWLAAPDERADAATFLDVLAGQVPFRIYRVVTLKGGPVVPEDGAGDFGGLCRDRGIEHRFATNRHPWARYRGARMGRMIQESVTFASGAYLAGMLRDFARAYNYRRRLKTLRGRTPHQAICDAWREAPERFLTDPHHEIMGLEIASAPPRHEL